MAYEIKPINLETIPTKRRIDPEIAYHKEEMAKAMRACAPGTGFNTPVGMNFPVHMMAAHMQYVASKMNAKFCRKKQPDGTFLIWRWE